MVIISEYVRELVSKKVKEGRKNAIVGYTLYHYDRDLHNGSYYCYINKRKERKEPMEKHDILTFKICREVELKN